MASKTKATKGNAGANVHAEANAKTMEALGGTDENAKEQGSRLKAHRQ